MPKVPAGLNPVRAENSLTSPLPTPAHPGPDAPDRPIPACDSVLQENKPFGVIDGAGVVRTLEAVPNTERAKNSQAYVEQRFAHPHFRDSCLNGDDHA